VLPGYNTNGFAHHRLEDAIDILAQLGCKSIALTLDVHHLDPLGGELERRADEIRSLLRELGLGSVIETGARFILDPWEKHSPTLLDRLDTSRSLRAWFLRKCIETAALVEADAVSFWSGKAPDPEPDEVIFTRLVAECRALCEYSATRGVRIAFEPEPGMFIDTMEKYERLFHAVNRPNFGLTLDIGHLQCMGEVPMAPHIERWKDVLWNVHIEDMRTGVHDHLPFGEGEIDFPPVFDALKRIGYTGGLHVELSRHSHDAIEVASRSLEFLKKGIGE
jgi:sugar phosphate isomerase/epimerase